MVPNWLTRQLGRRRTWANCGTRRPSARHLRRPAFERLEQRTLLATVDYFGGGTLAIYVNHGDDVVLGGSSLDGDSPAPLFVETNGSVSLTGSAASYFDLVGSRATLKSGTQLVVVNLMIQDQDDSGNCRFTFGDGTNDLPSFAGASLMVDQGFTALTIRSNINTGACGQSYYSPAAISGTVSLSGQDSSFGLLGVGDGTNTAGTVVVNLSSADQLAATSSVTANSDGLLNLNGHNQTIAGLTMTGGEIRTSGATLTLGCDVSTNACDDSAILAGTVNLGGTRSFTAADGSADTDLLISAAISPERGGCRSSAIGTATASKPSGCTIRLLRCSISATRTPAVGRI